MMFLWISVFLTLTAPVFGSQVFHSDKYREEENAKQLSTRLLRLMRSYYEDASQRITELNNPRFMYEETANYEQGYVMHEIIERYKKLVEHLHYMVKFKAITVYDCLERTELIQKLYFEIYHLANMMHEIPQKYLSAGNFAEAKKKNHTEHLKAKQAMKDMEERRKRERKKRLKMLKKRRKVIKTLPSTKQSAKRDPYNPHWPIDYGWEIDYIG